MLARIVLDENKGILFCIKILSSYNRHLKNLYKSLKQSVLLRNYFTMEN